MPADIAMEVITMGPRPLMPGLDQRLGALHAAAHHLDREVHEQDRVLGDDAHQHQDADQHRHGDGVAGQDQRAGHAADGERQRQKDGEGLDHVLEEQDQHREHEHEAHDHRVAEGSLQLRLDLGVAGLGDAHGGGQLDALGQLLEPGRGRAERHAGGRFAPMVAMRSRLSRSMVLGPSAMGHVGDRAQRHRAPGRRGDLKRLGPPDVVGRHVAQFDADRDQPVVERHLGERGVDVADGRHPQGLRDLARGDAEARGLLELRPHLELGARQRALRADVGEQRVAAQRRLEPADGEVEVGFVRGQDAEGHVPLAPVVELDGAHVRDGGDLGEDLRLDLRLRAHAAVRRHRGIAGPTTGTARRASTALRTSEWSSLSSSAATEARRTSRSPVGELPPSTNTEATPPTSATARWIAWVVRSVSSRVAPGGSSTLIDTRDTSSGGMKLPGMRSRKKSEAASTATAASMVR
jgi:hypothetical protein